MNRRQVHPGRANEQGVALIIALLVVAMASTAIVSLTQTQRIDMRRTENIFSRDQAGFIALGGEIWAKKMLAKDLTEGGLDTLDENWAEKIAPIVLERGVVSGYIEDMEGRFNLNNLIVGGNQSLLDMGRFRRLLLHQGLSPELAYAVADWIDTNGDLGGPGGAEDPDYLGMDPPYRAANRPLVSTTELRVIKGFDDESFQKLAPYVTALPSYTDINVNTASPEILRTLVEDIKDGDVERLLERRKQKPFQDMNDFVNEPTLSRYVVTPRGIGVSSHHFLVTIHARIGPSRIHQFTLLNRSNNGMLVLMRGQGVL
ncbi:MAG: type II secretion system minor pseudopilin GspK [Magnetococcales bacterium]|nr:type II secretion system minor pseudopilin GspK [Magnetococcales bacterium]